MEYQRTNHDSKEFGSIAILTILIMLVLAMLSFSCEDKCETFYSYVAYDPVYITSKELREAVGVVEPIEIKTPGKIYMLGNTLLVNEVGSGIHVIDNTNPRNPRKLSFIKIPGNYDMAGIGNFIYADSYVDLLVFDISNLNDIKQVKRVEGVFQNYYSTFGYFDQQGRILVEYKERLVEEFVETDCGSGNMTAEFADMLVRPAVMPNRLMAQASSASPSSGSSPTAAGVGGSMARFTIAGTHMYTVDFHSIRVFDVRNPSTPKAGDRTDIGWGIETIFPYKDKLFLGAQNGMYIYQRRSNGEVNFISKYEHITSCDPVVVQDDIAYVTLRNGVECNGFTNQLEVIDVSDVKKPKLLEVYPMKNPHGLGIDGTCLFVCEGAYGLKVFDASDISAIDKNMLKYYDNIHAYDVIPYNNVLMMIGNDGLYQFNYDCTNGNISLLSSLPIVPL